MSTCTARAVPVYAAVLGWVVLAQLLGCAEIPDEVILQETKYTSMEFLIGPEDVLEVVVWKNEDLSRQVVVRPDGMISLPLIGDVQANGLHANKLADRIKERFKEYMESPTVSVSVTQVNSYSIYVLGEVTNPGKYQLKSYATVLQAIAVAGGFTQFASKNNLRVIRNGVNGHGEQGEIRIPVRYDDLVSGEGGARNFVLLSGDVVVVP